jgi:DAK2 domain fusion protein YloV
MSEPSVKGTTGGRARRFGVITAPMGPTLDARTLREAMSRFLEALRTHQGEIDSLNVFPVPDGDTGTNLLLTQTAVDEALRDLDGDLAEVGEAVSRAALMGARGNSGVILSQVLRGFCLRFCHQASPGPRDLAEALSEGSDQANRSVAEPVDGTMLSVLADAARAAEGSAADGAPPGLVADAALRAGQRSLARTPRQLPALRQAGVVDAGGKGIVLLLDAIRSAVEGIPLSVEVGPLGPVGERQEPSEKAGPTYGYEVMYLVECEDGAVPALRERLGVLGDSLVVVGGGGLYNVHIHTDEPGLAVEEGIEAGRPRGIRIISLDEQVAEACVAGEARAVRAGEGGAEATAAPDGDGTSALVAVVSGEGAAALFRSLGASVVAGGPGNNPSVGELAEAIAAVPSDAVVLLPNHANVVPAARQAADGSGKTVAVIPTGSVPEGLAAATAFNPECAVEENEDMARRAAAAVTAIEVARASKDADTAAGPVRVGGFLAMAGGQVRSVGEDPIEVAMEVLRGMVGDEHEIVTVLTGDAADGDDGDRAAAAISHAFPHLEVEVHAGGQPQYPLLIGLE